MRASALLKRDPDELASGADAMLLEELLEGGFHQRFGNVDARRDLLVGQPFHHGAQHSLLAARESFRRIPGLGVGAQVTLKSGINVELPAHDRANRIHQKIWRVLFQKNSRGAGLHQPARLENTEDRRDYQNASAKSLLSGRLEKLEAPLSSKVYIQQHQIDFGRAQDFQRFFDGAATADNCKIAFRIEQPRSALAQQGMIVNEKNSGARQLRVHTRP